MLRGAILALTLAGALLLAPAGQAALCNSGAKVDLDIGAAASVPRVKGEELTTFGTSGARQQAALLTSGGANVCRAAPSASTQRALARIDTLVAQGKTAEAKALLRQTLADVERDRRRRSSRGARSSSAAPARRPGEAARTRPATSA